MRRGVPIPHRRVTIYTDGACIRNPGPGGFAALLRSDSRQKVVTGGFRRTTNNRMEIMGVIAALEALKKPCDVVVYSDSGYVVNTMVGGLARRWRERRWVRPGGERVLNADLWERLLSLTARHSVEFRWLPGHGTSEENRACDALARDAARHPALPVDRPFEAEQRRKYAARSRLPGKRL